MVLKAIFFDLDYTLYDQRQYLLGAFWDVADTIATECHLDTESLYSSLLAVWEGIGTDYSYLFNDWLNQLGLSTQARIKRCMDAFHAHQPKSLTLYPGVDQTLCDLKNGYLLGLITDGDTSMQQRKVAALNLVERFDLIVYTKQLTLNKPDPRIFQYALREAKLSATQTAYVGDHPVKDIIGARRAGLYAVRLLSGEFRDLPDDERFPPHHRIKDIKCLKKLVEEIETCGDLG